MQLKEISLAFKRTTTDEDNFASNAFRLRRIIDLLEAHFSQLPRLNGIDTFFNVLKVCIRTRMTDYARAQEREAKVFFCFFLFMPRGRARRLISAGNYEPPLTA